MKSKGKYKTFFSIIPIRENSENKKLKIFAGFFGVSFTIYLCVSGVSVWIQTFEFIEILIQTSDFFLLLASVLISIIAMLISNTYNEKISGLLNGIIETNSTLNIIQDVVLGTKGKKTRKTSQLIGALGFIDLILICILFIVNTFFQVSEMCITNPINWLSLTIDINTVAIDVLMILLNILSVVDCICSFKSYKHTICDIECINQKIFDEYNKNKVNEVLKSTV